MAFKGLILTRLQLRDASACDFKSKGVSPAPSCRFTVMLKKKKNEEKRLSCIGMVGACVRAEEVPGARYPKLMKRLTAVKYSRANLRAAQIQSVSGSALPPMRAGTH